MVRLKKTLGFTLIELMIVVAVIAILASIAYPSYRDSVRKSKRKLFPCTYGFVHVLRLKRPSTAEGRNVVHCFNIAVELMATYPRTSIDRVTNARGSCVQCSDPRRRAAQLVVTYGDPRPSEGGIRQHNDRGQSVHKQLARLHSAVHDNNNNVRRDRRRTPTRCDTR